MKTSLPTATLLTLLALAAAPAASAQVSVVTGVREANGGSSVVLTFTVTNNSPQRMRDFHLRCPKKVKGTPQRSDNGTPGDSSDDYTGSKRNGEIHWISTATNGGTPTGGTTTFSVVVDGMSLAEYQRSKQQATWFATHDGEPHLKDRSGQIASGTQDASGQPVEMALASTGMSVQPFAFAQRGQALPLLIHAPEYPAANYVLLCSLQEGPGIPFGPNALLPLSYDPLLELSLMNVFAQPHPVFQGFAGPVDPLGTGRAQLLIPPDPLLGGLELSIAGLTIDLSSPEVFVRASDASRIRVE